MRDGRELKPRMSLRSSGLRSVYPVIASAAKQSISQTKKEWIASRSLSSGAHSRDPLARNDGGESTTLTYPFFRAKAGRRNVITRVASSSDTIRCPVMNLPLQQAATAPLANHPPISYMIRQKAQQLPAIFQGDVTGG
jgi:hypothetical protein